MRVLIACEISGRVRDAFIARGCDAWSCDLLPSLAPGPHYQEDVRDHLEDGWDMMIAFPPCTYLAGSGLHWNHRRPLREMLTHEAMLFVFQLIDAPIPRIALENPVGCISTHYRPPDQTIQPWQFGEPESKRTCLWLKNLPPLQATHRERDWFCEELPAKNPATGRWFNQTASGQNRLSPSPRRAQVRAMTYPAVARAMADQWAHLAPLPRPEDK